MNSKKAISGVIVTIMIVLIAVVAVGILWAALRPGIEQSAETAGEKTACIGVSLTLSDLSCNKVSGVVKAKITRGADTEGAIKMIAVVNGTPQTEIDAPAALASISKQYTGYGGADTIEIKVAPKLGDTLCDATDTKTITCVSI